MEERRFDDLARALGRGASRRQVLKGLAAGLIGGLFGVRGGIGETASVAAAGEACSSAKLQQCYQHAAQTRDAALAGLCSAQPGGSSGGSGEEIFDAACKLQVSRKYYRDLESCDHAQCPHGGTCVNGHCCEGEHCCDPGVQCGGTSAFEPPEFCCPEGNSCCHDKCCGPDKTCCTQVDHGLPFGLRSVSFSYNCADLHDDPNNCGACGHRCRGAQVCHDGSCVCPEGTHTCTGTFNTVCCKPNERCDSSNIFGFEVCEPVCKTCEIYDPNDPETPCKPVECGVCQECDGSTGQCVDQANGAVCGSGLSCCGGQCQADSEECNGGGKGGDTCGECQTEDDNGNCVPADDGGACSSCGICSSGLCVPDPNRTCPTCQTCGANGACGDVTDETSCGDNQVCCTGQCKTGTNCTDCPDGPTQHQCPPDVNGNQLCCHNALPCCAGFAGNGQCGPTNGACCDVGTQFVCGSVTSVCCDYATEVCSSPDDGSTGLCCPTGQRAVSDGSCCPVGQICDISGGQGNTICCPSGEQCASDPEQTKFVCCAGVNSDSEGTCCTDPVFYATCADDTYICCPSEDEATCCANHGGAK